MRAKSAEDDDEQQRALATVGPGGAQRQPGAPGGARGGEVAQQVAEIDRRVAVAEAETA